MKILISGGSGCLGKTLVDFFSANNTVYAPSSAEMNILNMNDMEKIFREFKPDIVFHCAAVVNADLVQENKKRAYHVNVIGTRNIAKLVRQHDCAMIFFSSDYVYSGGDNPHKEDEILDPVNYYGFTKALGEEIVQNLCDKFYILRIAWLFGPYGESFYYKIMNKLSEEKLMVVSDQYGTPTYTVHLASMINELIATRKYGIYNCSNEEYCSWAEYAEEIIRIHGYNNVVCHVTSEEFSSKAVRPKNSKLSKEKIYSIGVSPLPSWKAALKEFIMSTTKK